MPNQLIFCLKYRNVIILEREWHYGDFIPDIYYYYESLNAYKYGFSYKANKFIMYDRIGDNT